MTEWDRRFPPKREVEVVDLPEFPRRFRFGFFILAGLIVGGLLIGAMAKTLGDWMGVQRDSKLVQFENKTGGNDHEDRRKD